MPPTPRRHVGLFDRLITGAYGLLLASALRLRWVVLLVVVALLAMTGWQAARLGSEFLPRLSEGAIVANTMVAPGTIAPSVSASKVFTAPAIIPLLAAMNKASDAETLRVRLLSIAQHRQAPAIARGPI